MVKAVAMHTHDRISFRRCRRKWHLSSPLRRNLKKKAQSSAPLWFGTGGHFALEDYHGYNFFGHPVEAFKAYVGTFDEETLTLEDDAVQEMMELAEGVLNHYLEFWKKREKFKVVWQTNQDGELEPMVEVGFTLQLPDVFTFVYDEDSQEWIKVPIYYHGTLDKVVEDEDGNWWIVDYKFVKAIETSKLSMDEQISTYLWGAEQFLDHEIAGMLYIQIAKKAPKHVKMTQKGLSTDKRQATTYDIALADIKQEYGEDIPSKYTAFLEELKMKETYEGDGFIRFDKVIRTERQKASTFYHILEEAKEMTNPDIACYPNPTRDCSWDCPFRSVCLAMEEQADYEYLLLENFEPRNETMEGELEEWRLKLIEMYGYNTESFQHMLSSRPMHPHHLLRLHRKSDKLKLKQTKRQLQSAIKRLYKLQPVFDTREKTRT